MRIRLNRNNSEFGQHWHRFVASEKRINAIIQAIPDPFFIIDRDGTYIEYSAHDISLLKTCDGVLIGKNISDTFPAVEVPRLLSVIRSALEKQKLTIVQYEMEVQAGLRQFECRIVPLEADTVVFFAHDITDRVERDAVIQKSLNEKEVLLREIHHRVKNNLQVISSMVSLQAEQFVDAHDRSLVVDTQHRIQSMARLHEMLYQAENVAEINVAPYFSSVIDELLVSFSSGHCKLKISKNIMNLRVSLDVALPLGLIVNELVLNSLQFLHPNDSSGLLEIDFHSEGAMVYLSIRNEGPIKVSDFIRGESISLGYVLVPALVHQLEGSLAILPGDAGNIDIEFSRQTLCGHLSHDVPVDEKVP